jgi:hypothetical protein
MRTGRRHTSTLWCTQLALLHDENDIFHGARARTEGKLYIHHGKAQAAGKSENKNVARAFSGSVRHRWSLQLAGFDTSMVTRFLTSTKKP